MTSSAFLPNSLPNLVAWYRKGVGQSSSTWLDQSGNAHDMAMTASPTISGGAYTFNGTTQYGQASFTLAQPLTIFCRLSVPSYQANAYMHDGTAPSSAAMLMNTPSPAVALFAGSGQVVDATHFPIGSLGNVVSIFNGASSNINVTSVANKVTGTPGTTAPGGLTAAVAGNQVTGPCNMTLVEFGAYSDAKGDTDITSLLSYLATL